MRKQLILLLAGWLVTMVAVFFIGRATKSGGVTIQSPPSLPAYQPPPEPPDQPLVAKSETDAAMALPSSLKVTQDNVIRTLLNNDPVERMSTFTAMLSNLTPGNAPAMVRIFDRIPQGYDRNWERNLALYSWAKVDGPAAIDYISRPDNSGRGREMGAYHVLTGWATVDSVAAEKWARTRSRRQDNSFLVGVIHGVARVDLDRATQLTYSLPYGRNRGRAVDVLVDGYFQRGVEAAVEWARNLPELDQRLRSGITTRVVSKLAAYDPYTSIDLAMNLPEGDGRMSALGEVADGWVRKDPTKAAAWVAGLENPRMRSEALAAVVGEWARTEPEKTAEYLNQFAQGPHLDKALERFAWRLREENPEASLVWAGQIYNKTRRMEMLERLASDWLARDEYNAEKYLKR